MVTTPASGDPVTQVATRDSSNNSPEVGEMPKIFGLTKRNKTYYYRSRIYDFFSIFFPPAKDGTCRKEYVRWSWLVRQPGGCTKQWLMVGM